MARVRHQISFRQDDPRHTQALGFLYRQERKSDYIVNCILKAEQQGQLKSIFLEVLGECLSGMQIAAAPIVSAVQEKQSTITQPDAQRSLPDSDELNPALLRFLDEF